MGARIEACGVAREHAGTPRRRCSKSTCDRAGSLENASWGHQVAKNSSRHGLRAHRSACAAPAQESGKQPRRPSSVTSVPSSTGSGRIKAAVLSAARMTTRRGARVENDDADGDRCHEESRERARAPAFRGAGRRGRAEGVKLRLRLAGQGLQRGAEPRRIGSRQVKTRPEEASNYGDRAGDLERSASSATRTTWSAELAARRRGAVARRRRALQRLQQIPLPFGTVLPVVITLTQEAGTGLAEEEIFRKR